MYPLTYRLTPISGDLPAISVFIIMKKVSYAYLIKNGNLPVHGEFECQTNSNQELMEKGAVEILKSLKNKGIIGFAYVSEDDKNANIDIV